MKINGIVKNGVVVPAPGTALPEGQRVEIVPVAESPEESFLRESAVQYQTTNALPDDLAVNHDYYLHGSRKQQPRRGRWIQTGAPARELTEQESAADAARLGALAGETRNLPADLSANHDHYLHGLPRQ